MKLDGCLTALITPFTPDGGLDLDRLEEQIRFQAAGGVIGIVPCGTTGEAPTLSDDESGQVIARCVEIGKPLGLLVVAGTGSNCTAHAVAAQRRAAAIGVDAGLSVNPYYNKPTQEGLYRHFRAVADAADLPVVLYNIPGRTGVTLKPETAQRLSRHPNIIAIKEATGSMDSASDILQRCGDAVTLLSGDDSMTLPFMSVGARGVVSVLSNIMPEKVSALCDAANAGRWTEARSLHFQLFALCRGLLGLETNPIPIKTAMRLLGRDSGVLRDPMCAASPDTVAALGPLLTTAGLL